MSRIDLPHLVGATESLRDERVVHRIVMDTDDAHRARARRGPRSPCQVLRTR